MCTATHDRQSGANARGSPRAVAIAIAAALVAALGAGALSGAQPAEENQDHRCMQCHGQPHIADLGPEERRSMVGTRLDPDEAAPTEPAPVAVPLEDAPATRPGLYVLHEDLAASPHADLLCVDCHDDAALLPHPPTLEKATCAETCHEQIAIDYDGSAHHDALVEGDPLSPTCASCHGGHDMLSVEDRSAPQHKLNSLFLCGDCHEQHSASNGQRDPSAKVSDYLDSSHARGVTRAGLFMAATCADCHDAHNVLRSDNPASTVSRDNIPDTCGQCHIGVSEIYDDSVHGRKHAEANGDAAVCTDCHTAHQITLASSRSFVRDVIEECGECHDTRTEGRTGSRSYYETYHLSYHGQVSRLGAQRAARCSDCHGSHDIRPLDDPASRVSDENLVETCAECHPGANANFVKFDPHADHRDGENYPILHGVWLYFIILMSTVFGLFGLHTVLWFARSTVERRRHSHPAPHLRAKTSIRRFSKINRVNHLFVMLTFFGLTATGIPLVFSDAAWADVMMRMFGGVEAAGLWHRVFAVMLIGNFIVHFIGLGLSFVRRRCSAKDWLFGPNSLLPRWKDVTDVFGMIRWFFGLGPRPRFDRWTYWEKFDYWAEVGGSMIIGGSGLLLWFPEEAAVIFPGWVFNVAMIVHGYEALLAIGFIFTIHFFNAHLRPGVFPADLVIFTGNLPEEELKEQRPAEYERLVLSGRLEALREPAPDPARRPGMIAVAIALVSIGVILVSLIIIGGLT